mmetsp:Transcript_82515/g.238385  ORF Transcript_82515/g.238385 Transcript_82515/m.238385 type:complete len:303 (-) Transcript_82515:330-1238(-)
MGEKLRQGSFLLEVSCLRLTARPRRRPHVEADAVVVDLGDHAAARRQRVPADTGEADVHPEHVRHGVLQFPMGQKDVELVHRVGQRSMGEAQECRDEVAAPVRDLVALPEELLGQHALHDVVEVADRGFRQPPTDRRVQAFVGGECEAVHHGLQGPSKVLPLALPPERPGLEGTAASFRYNSKQLSVFVVELRLVRNVPNLAILRQRFPARAVARRIQENVDAALRRGDGDDIRPLGLEAFDACAQREHAARQGARRDDVPPRALRQKGERAVVHVGPLGQEVAVAMAQEAPGLPILSHADT